MMTHKEYMAASCENGYSAHRRYYGQFVNDRTIAFVVQSIGRDALLASRDEHLNDISLRKWDMLVPIIPLAASLEDAGDYLTIGNGVCIAKEAARQYIERNKA